MKRVLAVAITVATATMTAGAAIVPAMAAQRPAAQRAGGQRAGAGSAPLLIASQLDNGRYVTVVQCHGSVRTPPPVQAGLPGTPLTVHGGGSSPGLLAMLRQPNPYQTVYTCTVVVKERPPARPKPRTAGRRTCVVVSGGTHPGGGRCKKVTLNTGFGGMAAQVARHRPAS